MRRRRKSFKALSVCSVYVRVFSQFVLHFLTFTKCVHHAAFLGSFVKSFLQLYCLVIGCYCIRLTNHNDTPFCEFKNFVKTKTSKMYVICIRFRFVDRALLTRFVIISLTAYNYETSSKKYSI